jgi:hypothetical protein
MDLVSNRSKGPFDGTLRRLLLQVIGGATIFKLYVYESSGVGVTLIISNFYSGTLYMGNVT